MFVKVWLLTVVFASQTDGRGGYTVTSQTYTLPNLVSCEKLKESLHENHQIAGASCILSYTVVGK